MSVFPALFSTYGDFLAVPLASIFDSITEYVTTIPKKSVPSGINDLRNISCTMLPSKIYESYILNWIQEEVSTKKNQFGRVKGCSIAHLRGAR